MQRKGMQHVRMPVRTGFVAFVASYNTAFGCVLYCIATFLMLQHNTTQQRLQHNSTTGYIRAAQYRKRANYYIAEIANGHLDN
jgi:hypothetical protein